MSVSWDFPVWRISNLLNATREGWRGAAGWDLGGNEKKKMEKILENLWEKMNYWRKSVQWKVPEELSLQTYAMAFGIEGLVQKSQIYGRHVFRSWFITSPSAIFTRAHRKKLSGFSTRKSWSADQGMLLPLPGTITLRVDPLSLLQHLCNSEPNVWPNSNNHKRPCCIYFLYWPLFLASSYFPGFPIFQLPSLSYSFYMVYSMCHGNKPQNPSFGIRQV